MEFSPRKAGNNKTYCCVPHCNSKASKETRLRFHLFPKRNSGNVNLTKKFGKVEIVDRRKAWIWRLKIGKKVSDYMRVCSKHFKSEDYMIGPEIKKHMLKRCAVPSQNIPETKQTSNTEKKEKQVQKHKQQRQERQARRNLTKNFMLLQCENTSIDMQPESENQQKNEDREQLKNETEKTAEGLLSLLSTDRTKQSVQYKDFCVQVNTGQLTTACDLINTDDQLNSLTGLHSFSLLNTVSNLVYRINTEKRVHRLSIKHRVILAFMKMKLDLSYVVLSVLFGYITSQTCKTIFYDMLDKLSCVLAPAIHFPSLEEINANIPKYFKDYKNVRIILDCTEIQVQTPKCLCCRIRFYSSYKASVTVKFMCGVTPSGLISFISQAYPGRTSDKCIFEQSGLISKLNMFTDSIMVDKGFLTKFVKTIA